MTSKTIFDLHLTDLLSFVKTCCHENLHDTLVDLREHSLRRIQNPNLGQRVLLAERVLAFIRRIQRHLAHEENTLFPMITLGPRQGSGPYPINDLIDDHAEMIAIMQKIKGMTRDFEITPEMTSDCVSYYGKLIELERLLANHTQIENQVLHPMLLKIS